MQKTATVKLHMTKPTPFARPAGGEMSTVTGAFTLTIRADAGLDHTDAWLVLGLLSLASLYTISFVRSAPHPYEDAAMLMRYSENLARGHGIVWNVGEKPVDGATDFLVMVLVAGLVK